MISSTRDMVMATAERTVIMCARVEWANLLLCLIQNLVGEMGRTVVDVHHQYFLGQCLVGRQ